MNFETILNGASGANGDLIKSLTEPLEQLKYVGLAFTIIFFIGWLVGLVGNLMVKRSILKISKTLNEINNKLDKLDKLDLLIKPDYIQPSPQPIPETIEKS